MRLLPSDRERPLSRQNAARSHTLLLLLYTTLAGALTWPLAKRITTHVAGNGIDDPALAWNLWWIKERLVHQLNPDIFHADWMFFPININLGFYTLTPLNGLLSVPLQSAFSLIFASNILLFASFILGGYGTFLLTLYLVDKTALSPFDSRCIAAVAGIIFAFASSKLFYASLGQFNIASSYWIPFCVLYLLRMNDEHFSSCPEPGRRVRWGRNRMFKNAFFAGLFLVFQAWAELTYASFLLIFIAVYFLWLQLRRQPIAERLVVLRNFIIVGLLFAIGIAPILWAMVPDMLAEGDFFGSGGGFVDLFSADLFGYLVPTIQHPFLGKWVETLPFSKNLAQHIYIGYVGLGLALLGALTHPRSGRTTFTRPSALQPTTKGDAAELSPDSVDIGPRTSSSVTYSTRPQGQVETLNLTPLTTKGGTTAGTQVGYSKRFWLFNLLFFWLLTLGPILRWQGENVQLFGIPVYGPFALVSQLPFFSGNRYPSRYSVMLMLCIAILAAMGIAWLVDRLNALHTDRTVVSSRAVHPRTEEVGLRALLCPCGTCPSHTLDGQDARSPIRSTISQALTIGLCLIIGLLFLAEHLATPLAINDSQTPPIYETIRAEAGDFTVLELPTGWRNGAYVLGKSDELIMMQQWYQSVHGKRRLGGNTSRNPSYKFEYFVNAPLIGDLIGLMNADQEHIAEVVDAELPQMIARNRAIAPQVLDLLEVRFVTVDMTRSPLALQEFVEAALPVTLIEEWTGNDWRGEAQTIRLYAVDGAAQSGSATEQQGNGWTIRMGDEDSSIFLAEGWSALVVDGDGARYATRPQTELLVDIGDAGGMLRLEVADAATDQISVALNGAPLVVEVDEDSVSAQVPVGVAHAPLDRLSINWGANLRPMTDELSIVAMSAGQQVGDYARIVVNGVDVAQNQIGYNLAAIAPTGEVLESVVFNTHVTITEPRPTAAMAAWLQQWPTDTIFAGAVRDTAYAQLEQDAIDALTQIGIVADLRGKLRWSHAFIGARSQPQTSGGDAPQEQALLLAPAVASFGAAGSAPPVYGAIRLIEFEPLSP